MADSRFFYVTYIRTTPAKLWQALTEPEFTRRYWVQTWQDCAWTAGAPWKLMLPDGRVGDSGEVVEVEPQHRLLIKWRNEFMPALRDEGYSRMSYLLEPVGGSVKLTVTHEMDRPNSKFIAAIADGWPHLMSSLKSLLETGQPLAETEKWPAGM